uniref:SGNH hydrolase-type esterase domain-containing protein n=1 Tax=Calcidiscus leptoporus TaxID=127549 RepID=A0A7S0IP49_9EUKA|mmetsp:Transcript_15285/g.35164  ORF Transcript_15285/g.35164 Transcript_15285/m.35164 type:complete len:207 (+) Transcript_15285:295-915(+)
MCACAQTATGTIRRATRIPEAIVFSFGLWDMLYPPGNDVEQGVAAFNHSVRRFVDSLVRSLTWAARRFDGGGNGAPSARLFKASPWSIVPAPQLIWININSISAEALPSWKQPRMTAQLSRAYNAQATDVLRDAGLVVVDAYSLSHAHPKDSVDGVHYPGCVSHELTQQVSQTICAASPLNTPQLRRLGAIARRGKLHRFDSQRVS